MMMEINCISCNEGIPEVAKFCFKCGTQQKCKSCGTTIAKGANNCIECGIQLSESRLDSNKAINTIEFKETAVSREYKVAFSNEVGANVVDVVKNMLESQMGSQPLRLTNGGPSNSKEDVKTEDIPLEEVKPNENGNNPDSVVKTQESTEIPHIIDVEKTLECNEAHWILVYSFYISEQGKNTFSKDDVLTKYKAQRNTPSRISNFARNWDVLFKGLIRTIKEDEFRLTEKGVETAIGLIGGTIKSEMRSGSSKSSSKPSSKKSEGGKAKEEGKKGSKVTAKSIQPEEFDISKGAKKSSLEDFLKEKKVGENTFDRIVAIAYYVTKHCKSATFTAGNIEYAYKVLSLNKRPLHLYQTMINAKNKYLWFDKDDSTGKWKLARAGEIYVEEKLK